jgi:hypothetical protein
MSTTTLLIMILVHFFSLLSIISTPPGCSIHGDLTRKTFHAGNKGSLFSVNHVYYSKTIGHSFLGRNNGHFSRSISEQTCWATSTPSIHVTIVLCSKGSSAATIYQPLMALEQPSENTLGTCIKGPRMSLHWYSHPLTIHSPSTQTPTHQHRSWNQGDRPSNHKNAVSLPQVPGPGPQLGRPGDLRYAVLGGP